MIASNLFSPDHPRIMLYIEGTRTIVNVRWAVACRGGVLVVTGKVISPLTLTKFLKKQTKGVDTLLS